jgi:1,2-diacylglycerol 3-beta-galactosyltransferase
VINHSGFPIQLALVAGGDDELYAQLKAIEWHIPTHLYNFVKNMPTLMHASDGLISKAGGLIVTEALACGLPMIFMDVTPGQEEGNVDYVIRNGAGESAAEPIDVLEVLAHWLEHDQTLLHEQACQSRALGRPRSAYAAADYIWELAEPGKFSVPESRQSVIPKLVELLNQFGVSA